jgi:hypothetical protein
MKILYFGKFDEFWRTENYVSHALEEHGVEVIKHQRNAKRSCIAYDLEQVEKHKPNVVLFSKAHAMYYKELIPILRSSGIITVCWFWDLVWGLRSHSFPQFRSDLFYTTDGGNEDRWNEHLYEHRLLRQGIHEPEHILLPPPANGYVHDVLFAGRLTVYSHPKRSTMVQLLEKEFGMRFVQIREKRGMNLNKWLSRAKIVIGDSYPSPNYWSNRIYEMLGRGAFLLYPYTPGLEEEFVEGEHFIGFKQYDFEDMFAKIREWLPKEEERQRIRKAGFEQCGKFTYTKRVETILNDIIEFANKKNICL